MWKAFKKGFWEGILSLGDAFNPAQKPRLDYTDLDTKEELRKTWEQVGESMQWAMDQIDQNPEQQEPPKESRYHHPKRD